MTAPSLHPGSLIADRYRLQGILSSSKSAAVYAAVTTDGKTVAVKMFTPDLSSRPDLMDALQQYTTATNVLPAGVAAHVFDAGYDAETGSPFVVTEYLSMPTLAMAVSRERYSPAKTARMLLALAQALESAHEYQIAHLSLKPTNIFVVDDPAASDAMAVRLTDFGASVVRGPVAWPDEVANIAAYLALEQLPVGTTAGTSADIYAMALVAFYAMTGTQLWRLPRTGDREASRVEALSPPLCTKRATEMGITLPEKLDSVMAKALALDPTERFSSAQAFAYAFSGAVGVKPLGDYDDSIPPAKELEAPKPQGSQPAPISARPPGSGPVIGAQAWRGGTLQMNTSLVQDALAQAAAMPAAQAAAPAAPVTPSPSPAANPLAGTAPPTSASPTPTVSASDTVAVGGLASSGGFDQPDFAEAQAQARKRNLILAVVGIGGILLGATGILLKTFGGSSEPQSTAPGANSAGGAVTATASNQGTKPVETTASTVDSPQTGNPTPATSASASQPTVPKDPGEGNVTISCIPECDEIKIDNQPVTSPANIKPGPHRIQVTKAGYVTLYEKINVIQGVPINREYKMKTDSPKGAKKPCGTFANPCK